MSNSFPASPVVGRRSYGMEEEDWQRLACAYDTWNDHIAASSVIDEDLKSFVRDVFSEQGMWDYASDEPNLSQYLLMFSYRC